VLEEKIRFEPDRKLFNLRGYFFFVMNGNLHSDLGGVEKLRSSRLGVKKRGDIGGYWELYMKLAPPTRGRAAPIKKEGKKTIGPSLVTPLLTWGKNTSG